MALFVVACGFLLMLGGAVSLLLGFDIVMTERGAAMTIGGVVALSGGVIAVGIGLALVRLNQLLGALEARAARPVRGGAPDRPVVPLASEEARPSLAALEPVAPEPAAPLSPLHPSLPSGGSRMSSVATAGLAAGAAAIGTAAVLGRARSQEADPIPHEAVAPEAFLPEAAPQDEETVPPALPPQTMGVDAHEIPEVPEVLEVTRETSLGSIALPLDFEEELSRALAETSVPPDPVPTPAASAPPEDDRSFEDGLSKLLGRSVRPPAVPSEPARPQDLADLLDPQQAPTVAAREPDEADEEGLFVADVAPAEDVVEGVSEPMVSAEAENASDNQPHEMNEDLRDASSEMAAELEPALSPTVTDGLDDDHLFGDGKSSASDDGPAWGETPLTDHEDPNGASAAPLSPVLGTYSIGGRTYRMFADGSVEAASEAGEIERFASMEELRKHLARA